MLLALSNEVIQYNFDFPNKKLYRKKVLNSIYDGNAFRKEKWNALKIKILILKYNELIPP